jgi:hypothetical protein
MPATPARKGSGLPGVGGMASMKSKVRIQAQFSFSVGFSAGKMLIYSGAINDKIAIVETFTEHSIFNQRFLDFYVYNLANNDHLFSIPQISVRKKTITVF